MYDGEILLFTPAGGGIQVADGEQRVQGLRWTHAQHLSEENVDCYWRSDSDESDRSPSCSPFSLHAVSVAGVAAVHCCITPFPRTLAPPAHPWLGT